MLYFGLLKVDRKKLLLLPTISQEAAMLVALFLIFFIIKSDVRLCKTSEIQQHNEGRY